MIDYMGQNRSYHNNWSPYVHQKRNIVKFQCKNCASKTIMAKNRRKSNRSYQNNDISFTCCLKKHNNYICDYLSTSSPWCRGCCSSNSHCRNTCCHRGWVGVCSFRRRSTRGRRPYYFEKQHPNQKCPWWVLNWQNLLDNLQVPLHLWHYHVWMILKVDHHSCLQLQPIQAMQVKSLQQSRMNVDRYYFSQ